MNETVKTIDIEILKMFVFENSNHLLTLECNLELLDSLTNQINWLNESFAEVEYKKEDPRFYFRQWRTNLMVISSLITKVMNDTNEAATNLRYIQQGLEEDLEVGSGRKITGTSDDSTPTEIHNS